MSWECRHKSGDHCNRLDVECDPGRTGCVLHGRFYFPFAPEKNTKAMNDAAAPESAPRAGTDRRESSDGEGA
ncbi:MAG: hypothetical protein ACOC7V_11755 [Spirochaetota bacterium]